MLHNHPAFTVPAIYESEPCLHGGFVFECKGIEAGIYGNLAKDPDIPFINSSHRAFGEELNKIICNFLVIMSHSIGHGRKQNGCAFFIEGSNIFRISSL